MEKLNFDITQDGMLESRLSGGYVNIVQVNGGFNVFGYYNGRIIDLANSYESIYEALDVANNWAKETGVTK